MAAVHRYGGYNVHSTGDGIFALYEELVNTDSCRIIHNSRSHPYIQLYRQLIELGP